MKSLKIPLLRQSTTIYRITRNYTQLYWNISHQNTSRRDRKPWNQRKIYCCPTWRQQTVYLMKNRVHPQGVGVLRKTLPTPSLWYSLHRTHERHLYCFRLVNWILRTSKTRAVIGWPWNSRNSTLHPGNCEGNLETEGHHCLHPRESRCKLRILGLQDFK